jgi:hypothetical protein
MTQGPSPLRAPAEVQSEPVSTPTNHRNSRCKDCGAPLDVWNSCPNLPASEARLRSSVQGPAYWPPPAIRATLELRCRYARRWPRAWLRPDPSRSRLTQGSAQRKSERDSFAPAHSSTAGFYRGRREARSAFLRTTLCGSRPGCAEYHARNQDSHLP